MTYDPSRIPNPGSGQARLQGCRCPQQQALAIVVTPGKLMTYYKVNDDCPLHGTGSKWHEQNGGGK